MPPVEGATMADDDGFIGLPPGILPPSIEQDSGTVRRDRPERGQTDGVADRPARPRTRQDEIVFFPVVPGAKSNTVQLSV